MVQHFFSQRTLREKVLLVAFLWIILLIIASLSFDAISATWSSVKLNKKTLKLHDFWLDNQENIQASLMETLEKVNPERTFTAAKLVEQMDDYSRSSGINYELSSPKTEEGDLFNIHTVNVNIRGASIKQLILFDTKIQEFFPNIVLNNLTISANKQNPTQLDARMTVSSLELSPELSRKRANL